MKNYEWILFDADETLFEFNTFKGLACMLSQFGIAFTELDYNEFQIVNKSLWLEFQNGVIDAQQLQTQRFSKWGDRLDTPAQVLNDMFIKTMADISKPLDGATSLLDALRGKVKLGIITNGFTKLQQDRLKRNNLHNHFDLLVISEQVGVAKPNKGIFEHAFMHMGHPPRERVLMVGDTLETDILGGVNFGLDTCWINYNNKTGLEDITPKYQVNSLFELQNLLMN